MRKKLNRIKILINIAIKRLNKIEIKIKIKIEIDRIDIGKKILSVSKELKKLEEDLWNFLIISFLKIQAICKLTVKVLNCICLPCETI
jgi:hypothetical protein